MPTTEAKAGARARSPDQPSEVAEEQTGLTKEQAEGLLDWLEAHGARGVELHHVEGAGFTVRYSRPA